MTAERDKNQEIDPRIKGVYIPIGERGLEYIGKVLKERKLLDEEEEPQKPLTEKGVILLVKNLIEGLGISLSQVNFKEVPDNAKLNEGILIESIGNSFKEIQVESRDDCPGLNLIFPHPGCPIKKLPVIYDPENLDRKINDIVVLRQITITGFDPDEQSNETSSYKL